MLAATDNGGDDAFDPQNPIEEPARGQRRLQHAGRADSAKGYAMSRDPTRPADRVVFWVCACVALTLIYSAVYQYGYDAGREACRAPIRQEIKPMLPTSRI